MSHMIAINFSRMQDEEKIDVYDFGVILLEIIKGRPVKSEKQVDALRDQVVLCFVLLNYSKADFRLIHVSIKKCRNK